MALRPATLALTSWTALTLGCSLVLDLQGYEVAGEVDAGPPVTLLGPARAAFDSYRFDRGTARVFSVSAESGVSSNDSGSARVRASTLTTRAGGRVTLGADGRFEYAPPGAPGVFWGSDGFEYGLAADPPSSARVRLTLQPPALLLTELSSSPGAGFGVAGALAQDSLGWQPKSFAPAGDVNGDGFEDFIIGALGPTLRDSPFYSVGRGAFVVFGKADTTNLSLLDLSGEPPRGFAILGDDNEQTFDSFGYAVGAAGDVNGDGLDDVLIGAPGFFAGFADDASSGGAAIVVFGKADAAPVSSAEIRAGNGGGFAILPDAPGYVLAAVDVDGAGDVNGDGLDDVVVGVPVFSEPHGGAAGGAVVVFGKVGPEPVSIDAIAGGSAQGFAVFGAEPDEFLGFFVAGAGDLDGDGLSDIVASTDYTPVLANSGRNVVVFGKLDADPVRVAELGSGSSRGFVLVGVSRQDAAAYVGAGGDVNGDGFDDLIIGAPFAHLSDAPDAPMAEEMGALGSAAAPRDAGIVDAAPDAAGADGTDAGDPTPPAADPEPSLQGVVYVLFGGRELHDHSLAELTSEGGPGFAIGDPLGARGLGVSVSSGDIDGDGLSDVVASYAMSTTTPGQGFVVFGKRDTKPVLLSGSPASSGVFSVIGGSADAACGVIATGSDANADGLDDLLVGAALYADAPQAAGGAHVAFSWDLTGALDGRERAWIGSSRDDSFELSEGQVVIARGGNGIDTLRLGPELRELDLTLPGRYESIEVIDLRGNGPQRVRLDDAALRRLPQNHSGLAFMLARTLTVLGDADDQLEFAIEGYSTRGYSAGRIVYGQSGRYYGLEVSQGLMVVPPRAPTAGGGAAPLDGPLR